MFPTFFHVSPYLIFFLVFLSYVVTAYTFYFEKKTKDNVLALQIFHLIA